jgi:hypothetical protein
LKVSTTIGLLGCGNIRAIIGTKMGHPPDISSFPEGRDYKDGTRTTATIFTRLARSASLYLLPRKRVELAKC